MRAAAEVDVSDWTPELQEARGSGANEWLRDTSGRQWLFKATRAARDTGEPQGEDWAEKVVERLAALLRVPCATVELAYRVVAGRVHRGVVCLDLAGPGVSLLNGHNLLIDVPGYRYRDSGGVRPPRNHVGHSAATVAAQLRLHQVDPPDDADSSGMSAFDVFAGFLVLDAWVGNSDRHEDNWAVLRTPDGAMSLAPSYDHGAALGSTLTEERRTELAGDDPGLERFAARGYGKKFADGAKVPLTTVAADALAMAGTPTRDHWLDRLSAISGDEIRNAVDGIPRMSDPARKFCEQLLRINRRRLLDDRR